MALSLVHFLGHFFQYCVLGTPNQTCCFGNYLTWLSSHQNFAPVTQVLPLSHFFLLTTHHDQEVAHLLPNTSHPLIDATVMRQSVLFTSPLSGLTESQSLFFCLAYVHWIDRKTWCPRPPDVCFSCPEGRHLRINLNEFKSGKNSKNHIFVLDTWIGTAC